MYQTRWGFSTALLTIIYGLYTVGVVVTVFLVGPLSDVVGRKRVIVPALWLMAIGLVTCAAAPNVWVLMLGRILQGLAVGAGVTTAVAQLGDLRPEPRDHGRVALTATVATVAGLAGGPLVAGSLAEFGPAPTVLPYTAALLLVVGTLLASVHVPQIEEGYGKYAIHHRTTANSFLNEEIVGQIKKSNRRTILISGVATELAVQLPALVAAELGLRAVLVLDACGGLSARTEQAVLARIAQAGATTTCVLTLAGELAGDFREPIAQQSIGVVFEMASS